VNGVARVDDRCMLFAVLGKSVNLSHKILPMRLFLTPSKWLSLVTAGTYNESSNENVLFLTAIPPLDVLVHVRFSP
jgi:hypothetical protein